MKGASDSPATLSLDRRSLEHILRTSIAAAISLLVARLVHLPEAYWSAITTLVVMQSSLGGSAKISIQRLVGTAIGATIGGLLTLHFAGNAFAFALGVLTSGIMCAILRLDRNGYRYAGITVAIVMLVARAQAGWTIAMHRFVEVAIGITVGLLFTALWPEHTK